MPMLNRLIVLALAASTAAIRLRSPPAEIPLPAVFDAIEPEYSGEPVVKPPIAAETPKPIMTPFVRPMADGQWEGGVPNIENLAPDRRVFPTEEEAAKWVKGRLSGPSSEQQQQQQQQGQQQQQQQQQQQGQQQQGQQQQKIQQQTQQEPAMQQQQAPPAMGFKAKKNKAKAKKNKAKKYTPLTEAQLAAVGETPSILDPNDATLPVYVPSRAEHEDNMFDRTEEEQEAHVSAELDLDASVGKPDEAAVYEEKANEEADEAQLASTDPTEQEAAVGSEVAEREQHLKVTHKLRDTLAKYKPPML